MLMQVPFMSRSVIAQLILNLNQIKKAFCASSKALLMAHHHARATGQLLRRPHGLGRRIDLHMVTGKWADSQVDTWGEGCLLASGVWIAFLQSCSARAITDC